MMTSTCCLGYNTAKSHSTSGRDGADQPTIKAKGRQKAVWMIIKMARLQASFY
jgi:hypothetical protein